MIRAMLFAPAAVAGGINIAYPDNIKRGNKKHMSALVVVNYHDPYKAEEVRLKLRKLQSEYLLDLEDAVVAVKDENGKVKLHEAVNLTAEAQHKKDGIE